MSKETITTPSGGNLAEAAKAAQGKGLPPVHQWHPEHSGTLDMRIARDGTWFYQGSPITRPGLVGLFSTILRKDVEGYVLVTPVEKWSITVEDAPFVAVDINVEGDGAGQVVIFDTNVGDRVVAGPENAIRVERDAGTGEPSPYVMIRDGLEALIDRKSFYRMIEICAHHEGWFGVWSDGEFFPVIASQDLSDQTEP